MMLTFDNFNRTSCLHSNVSWFGSVVCEDHYEVKLEIRVKFSNYRIAKSAGTFAVILHRCKSNDGGYSIITGQ